MTIQLNLLFSTKKEKLYYITKGKEYLASFDRWASSPEWAMRFTRFEAMRKQVELGEITTKTKEVK